jgi:hypothetical protein
VLVSRRSAALIPRMPLLCGIALTLLGAGLRLRTADADRH